MSKSWGPIILPADFNSAQIFGMDPRLREREGKHGEIRQHGIYELGPFRFSSRGVGAFNPMEQF